MSDIIKKPPSDSSSGLILNKGKLRSTATPFQQRVNEARASQPEAATLPNRLCLMLDCSSSMQAHEQRGLTRIELLKDAVTAFVGRCNLADTAIAAETFPPSVKLPLTTNPVMLDTFGFGLQASGNTPMHDCVERCLVDIPMTRGIIVSDGEATDWGWHARTDDEWQENTSDLVLKRYVEAGIPIDCVHISADTRGEQLLRKIASVTGGLFIKFTDVSAFSTAFGYLAPGSRGLLANGTVRAEDIGAKEIR